ncbi:MAG: DUF1501 domain-containing protein [Planctomycetota bacterium]|nr:MAG: DUF1501 domain-containing protein [Planctomycetota bacterium]
MRPTRENGCTEYRTLSRRQFLGATAPAALAAVTAPAWLPRVAFARDECTSRDVIVSIFLRGGADGLTLCVPYAESNYYNLRQEIAVPPPDAGGADAAIDLDGFFGLPPALAPLTAAYDAGHLALIPASGLRNASRSHFDAQRFVEVGTPNDPALLTGWLGRHLLTTPPMTPGAVLRAMSLGFALPRALVGSPQALPVPDPGDFGLTGRPLTENARLGWLIDQYKQVDDPLRAAAENTQATIDLLEQIDFNGYVPAGGAVYGDDSFSQSLRAAAALIRAQVGVEAVAVDLGGWDTHDRQGSLAGMMANVMSTLATGLSAFHADVFSATANVTVVVVSEFGRTAAQNGSLGTDHGTGGCMMVMGDHIRGGQVLTRWPGLETEQLYEQRDVKITIDIRDILAEILQHRLGNANLAAVFPDYTPKYRGVTTCVPRMDADAQAVDP